MYLNLKEARKELTKNGFLIVRFEKGSMKVPMICLKTGKNDFKEIQPRDSFIDKIKGNTLIVDKEQEILPTLELQVLKDYDTREEVIKSHKALQKQLKKEAKKFLNVKNAIIARGAGNKYFVIDIDNNEASLIDQSLIDIQEVCYTKEEVQKCLNDSLINLKSKAYDRQMSIWNSVKIAK